jgi:hypothetical protein
LAQVGDGLRFALMLIVAHAAARCVVHARRSLVPSTAVRS